MTDRAFDQLVDMALRAERLAKNERSRIKRGLKKAGVIVDGRNTSSN